MAGVAARIRVLYLTAFIIDCGYRFSKMNLRAFDTGELDTPCVACGGDPTTFFKTSSGESRNYCPDCAEDALRFYDEDDDPTEPHPTVTDCYRCSRVTLARDTTGGVCKGCNTDGDN